MKSFSLNIFTSKRLFVTHPVREGLATALLYFSLHRLLQERNDYLLLTGCWYRAQAHFDASVIFYAAAAAGTQCGEEQPRRSKTTKKKKKLRVSSKHSFLTYQPSYDPDKEYDVDYRSF